MSYTPTQITTVTSATAFGTQGEQGIHCPIMRTADGYRIIPYCDGTNLFYAIGTSSGSWTSTQVCPLSAITKNVDFIFVPQNGANTGMIVAAIGSTSTEFTLYGLPYSGGGAVGTLLPAASCGGWSTSLKMAQIGNNVWILQDVGTAWFVNFITPTATSLGTNANAGMEYVLPTTFTNPTSQTNMLPLPNGTMYAITQGGSAWLAATFDISSTANAVFETPTLALGAAPAGICLSDTTSSPGIDIVTTAGATLVLQNRSNSGTYGSPMTIATVPSPSYPAGGILSQNTTTGDEIAMVFQGSPAHIYSVVKSNGVWGQLLQQDASPNAVAVNVAALQPDAYGLIGPAVAYVESGAASPYPMVYDDAGSAAGATPPGQPTNVKPTGPGVIGLGPFTVQSTTPSVAFTYNEPNSADILGGYRIVFTQNPTAPGSPALSTNASGGTLAAATYGVEVSYTNDNGETVASTSTSITTSGTTSTITIASPPPLGNATGWYAYMTQAGGTSYTRQQAAGSPTALGTNLTISAPPTSTGAAPLSTSTAGTPTTVWDSGKVSVINGCAPGGTYTVPYGGTALTAETAYGVVVYAEDSLGNLISPASASVGIYVAGGPPTATLDTTSLTQINPTFQFDYSQAQGMPCASYDIQLAQNGTTLYDSGRQTPATPIKASTLGTALTATGATSISTNQIVDSNTTIVLDHGGANPEVLTAGAVTGSGPYTVPVTPATVYTHAAGCAIATRFTTPGFACQAKVPNESTLDVTITTTVVPPSGVVAWQGTNTGIVTTDFPAPPAVTGLYAEAISGMIPTDGAYVSLRWNQAAGSGSVPNAATSNIYQRQSGTTTWTLIGNLPASTGLNTAKIYSAISNQAYDYAVAPLSSDGIPGALVDVTGVTLSLRLGFNLLDPANPTTSLELGLVEQSGSMPIWDPIVQQDFGVMFNREAPVVTTGTAFSYAHDSDMTYIFESGYQRVCQQQLQAWMQAGTTLLFREAINGLMFFATLKKAAPTSVQHSSIPGIVLNIAQSDPGSYTYVVTQ